MSDRSQKRFFKWANANDAQTIFRKTAKELRYECFGALFVKAGLPQEGDSQTTHDIILTDAMSLLQKVKSGMGSPDWNVLMVDIHLRTLLCVY